MAKKVSAEQAVKANLREGEEIRWQGETEVFPLLEKDAKGLILAKWIGTVIAAIAFLILYMTYNNNGNMMNVTLIVLAAAICVIVSPVLERQSVLRQHYWITNQRAILMTKGQSCYTMELSEIDDIQVVKGKTAQDCLVLGSCLFHEVDRQLRWRACHPKVDVQHENGADTAEDLIIFRAEGMVFFNVSDSEKALTCLHQRERV